MVTTRSPAPRRSCRMLPGSIVWSISIEDGACFFFFFFFTLVTGPRRSLSLLGDRRVYEPQMDGECQTLGPSGSSSSQHRRTLELVLQNGPAIECGGQGLESWFRRPGCNPGANGWFILSTPIQMPPANATRIGWHLWEIDLIFAPGLPPGWNGPAIECSVCRV